MKQKASNPLFFTHCKREQLVSLTEWWDALLKGLDANTFKEPEPVLQRQ
jgi:hypothetical protein